MNFCSNLTGHNNVNKHVKVVVKYFFKVCLINIKYSK